jgi:NDP-sugar pyrophosphorylase family protein
MKAFILAAGLGTRLRPLTNETPKPMLPVGDKPLLEHQFALLKKYGVTECAINLFYLPDKIKDYFGDGQKIGMKIHYIEEKELSGTAGPIKAFSEFFDEPFFVFYGDNLTDINLDKFTAFHNEHKGLISVALYHEPHPESKGIVELDENDQILRFKEKPKPEEITSHWANAGIYICEPEVLEHIPADTFYDFGHDLFPTLIEKSIPLYGYKMEDYLLDIGTHETYAKAQTDIEELNL